MKSQCEAIEAKGSSGGFNSFNSTRLLDSLRLTCSFVTEWRMQFSCAELQKSTAKEFGLREREQIMITERLEVSDYISQSFSLKTSVMKSFSFAKINWSH